MFIDLKKAYDRVPREVVWSCLVKKGVSLVYIQVIKDMYDGGRTKVKTLGGVIDDFKVSVKPFPFHSDYG